MTIKYYLHYQRMLISTAIPDFISLLEQTKEPISCYYYPIKCIVFNSQRIELNSKKTIRNTLLSCVKVCSISFFFFFG